MLPPPLASVTSNVCSGSVGSDLDTVSAALDEQILRTDVAKTLPRAEMASSEAKRKQLLTSCFMWCPQADSNCRPCLRRAVLYPLSYGGPGA
jgi:hypothetical protein